jgi:hypothetical protein
MSCSKCKMTDYAKKPKFQGMIILSFVLLFFMIVGIVTTFNYLKDWVINLF